jgi:hypothetical protein
MRSTKSALVVVFLCPLSGALAAHAQDAPVVEIASEAVGDPALGVEAPVTAEPALAEESSLEVTIEGAEASVEVVSEPAEPAPAPLPRTRSTWRVAEPAVERPRSRLPPSEQPPLPPEAIFLHGFRLGYLYIMETERPIDPRHADSPIYAQRYDMRSPHLFMIGYEAAWRMIGFDWLNLLLIGNVMISGLEQSRFFPSINLMLGFEIAQMAQIGVGVSVTPTKEEPAHMVLAAGWTPRIGSFYVPLHVFFVPDIAGHHKLGVTVGINFF